MRYPRTITSCCNRATLKSSGKNGIDFKSHALLVLLFLCSVFPFVPCSACSNGNCQLLDACATPTDCGPGLYCGNCPAVGKTQPFCTRGQSASPSSIINGLPFNKYTWLVTHNAFSIVDAPSRTGVQRITFYNQEDSVTNQLLNGVRGLMLDMYDFEDDIWLCHSLRGQCYNFTAFEPAIDTLKEVEAFLNNNPNEIVTIIIEDYVHSPRGLTKVFANAGLDKYWFPLSKMPKKGEDWPSVTDMIKQNYRLVVFTSDSSKEASEGIAYQWKHMVENECKNCIIFVQCEFGMYCSLHRLCGTFSAGDPGVVPGSCPNRKESKPLNSHTASLFLMNYFPTIPDQNEACKEHSVSLVDMVNTCYKTAGNVMPNFVAVNFYMVLNFNLEMFVNLSSLTKKRIVKSCT
ncbi:OLC1v1010170C1 [Oldenlandia corymbosa var. corymbosa]|uniref:OLC1v1010170C1 n=1 Tax=Oldenlandia corymbosa var. corymbosa TaxID=529605 RepID=A0AAV1DT69_OLDCO|nr:OLC1v1010170C1 [Oldenlandia corymbosa var. corymbosa]